MALSGQTMAALFDNSIAQFDREGRLLEWSAGFDEEFCAGPDDVVVGARLQDLLAEAFRRDGIARAAKNSDGEPVAPASADPSAANGFAQHQTPEYQDRLGRTIRVQYVITRSGGLFRTALPIAGGTPTHAALEAPEDRWCVNGDPNAEAVSSIRIMPNGHQQYEARSPKTAAIFGFSDDFDLNSDAIYTRIIQTAEEAERHRTLFASLRHTALPIMFDVRVRGCDGRLRWIRNSFAPTPMADGSTQVAIRIRDVTREKLAEDQLELLRSVITNVTDCVSILSTTAGGTTTTLYVNPAFERQTGQSAEQVVGKPVCPTSDRGKAFWEAIFSLDGSGDSAPNELCTLDIDGKVSWFEVKATTLEQRPDGSRRWVLMFRNIDDRRRAQQELLKAKDAAEAANRAKSEFLANMSHEIRTPMNGVLGMTGLLLETPLTAQQQHYARAVEQSGDALMTLINDILDISKLEAGKVELEIIDFDLVAMIESVATLMSPRAADKGVDLVIDIDPAAEMIFRGDANRLRQIVLNLVSNGVKFTEQGCVSLHVSALGAPKDAAAPWTLRIAVTDSGIGMDEDARQRLFQKFSQADSSITRRYGGSGLGLAICKQLVDLMGGRIGADSSPGQGSTFWFEAPLAASETPVLRPKPTRLPQLGGTRALAVDDIALNLEILTRQLQGLGLDQVTSMTQPKDAVAEVWRAWRSGQPYDVILLDQMMPGLSGEALATELRSIPEFAGVRMALVSSSGSSASGVGQAGLFDVVLDKPLRRGDLLRGLTTLFGEAPLAAAQDIEAGDPLSDQVEHCPAADAPDEIEFRGLRILLAEDHKINQQFALAVLAAGGHDADLAENGHQAVEAVRNFHYDVVLMDVHMPECDGIVATRLIRAMAPPKCDIPIIALTADAMSGSREEYIAAGMDDYLSKPIKAAELLSKLAELGARFDPPTLRQVAP